MQNFIMVQKQPACRYRLSLRQRIESF